MKGYSKLLEYVTYRIFIILITLVLFGMGLYGALQIQNKSDEIKHLPADSYLREWFEILKEDYPDLGYNVKLFTGPMDQDRELKKLDLLMRELVMLQENGQIINEMDSWWLAFNNSFLKEKSQTDLVQDDNSDNFTTLLSEFLHSSIGAKYKSNFAFDGELECNKPAPFVNATSIDIVYQKFSGPEEYIPSVNHINKLIKEANFSSTVFTNGRIYSGWEIDKVIADELIRNLILAVSCVFVITLILLADFVSAFLVLICVMFSLINVIGFFYFWGMAIEVLSCSNIVMSVGLSVDYSAHIAHAFLVSEGRLKYI